MAETEFDRLLRGEEPARPAPKQKSDLGEHEEVSLLVLYGTTRTVLQAIASELKMSEQEVVAEALSRLLEEVRSAG